MSRIKYLDIKNIRNFGDESSQARVNFIKPLTLIYGPNGSGKTTIIETIKYITTGEYPPKTYQGLNFVNNKKTSQTVLGQIKARILDEKGHELVVTRTIQLTRLENKTLKLQAPSNTITRLENNKEVHTSSQSADINNEILIAMGVLKPALNYVMFCNQEESNLLLEDEKQLKNIFDEIFDSYNAEYNTALDNTKKLINDCELNEKICKAKADKIKPWIDNVTGLQKKLKEEQFEEEKEKKKLTSIQKLVTAIDERLQEITNINIEYDDLQERMMATETEYKTAESRHKELELVLTAIDKNIIEKIDEKKQLNHNLLSANNQKNNLDIKLAEEIKNLQLLQKKNLAFDDNIKKRSQLLLKLFETWKIPQDNRELSEEDIKDYLQNLNNKYADFVSKLTSKIECNERKEKSLQEEINVYRTNVIKIKSEIDLKKKEKNKIQPEIQELETKIRELNSLHKAELEIDQINFEENENNIVDLYDNYKNDLNTLFNGNVPEKEFQENLKKIKKLLIDEKEKIIEIKNSETHKKKSLDIKLKLEMDKTAIYKSNLEEKEALVLSIYDNNNYEQCLTSQEKEIFCIESQITYFTHEKAFWTVWKDHMEKKGMFVL